MSPKKATPARPPIKAKSSLPAPRVSQKRVRIPWHQRRLVRGVLAVVVVVVLALVVWQGRRIWHHHTTTEHYKTAVASFNSIFQTDVSALSSLVTQAQNSPAAYTVGLMSQAEYTTETAQWLAAAETFRSQLSQKRVPPPLVNPQAELVDAADTVIDAVKTFQLVATTTDKTAAKTLVQQGTNQLGHALSVLENAATDEEKVVHAYHLTLPSHVTPAILNSPFSTPLEVVPVTSPTPTASPT
jgi:hypothetical protein